MSVLSISMSFVIAPVSIVDITICVNQSTATISFVALPVSIINRSISPDLMSSSMALIGFSIPFTFILRHVSHRHHVLFRFLNTWFVVFVLILSVLEVGQLVPYITNSLFLRFKLLRVHLNVNLSSVQHAWSSYESVYFFYALSSQKSSNDRLEFNNSKKWHIFAKVWINLFLLILCILPRLLGPTEVLVFLIYAVFITATSRTHYLYLLKY